jgi:hypothetical protein
MKTKKIRKRLNLTKRTVSNLGQLEMKGVQGGAFPITYDYWCILRTIGPCTTDGMHYCIPDPTTTK